MSLFTGEWLALREPADAASRAAHLVAPLARRGGAPRRIVDLATGTGANIRFLAPRLGGVQSWLAVDRDEGLLATLAAATWPPQVSVATKTLDLAADVESLPLAGCALVTASALLDLVSAAWLARLAGACATAGSDVLFALSYDGRIEWSPGDPDDAHVRALVNRHQRRDKGFGPALGPAAGARVGALLAASGYAVQTARSDWRLGAESRALQDALLDGWLAAAKEEAPATARALEAWATRRRACLAAGASHLVVGHTDLAALAP